MGIIRDSFNVNDDKWIRTQSIADVMILKHVISQQVPSEPNKFISQVNSECVLVNSECVLVLAVNHLSTIMAFGPCCRRFGVLAVVSEELVCCSQPFVYRFDIWLMVLWRPSSSQCIVVEMNIYILYCEFCSWWCCSTRRGCQTSL